MLIVEKGILMKPAPEPAGQGVDRLATGLAEG